MQFNYHFLKFLCPELIRIFKGLEVKECFSQNKEELIIGFVNGEQERYIRANFLPIFSCMDFPDRFQRGKKNTINLFPEIIGQEVSDIELISFERAFLLKFISGDMLLFKLHGTRSNILLYKKGCFVPEVLFRNDLRDDASLDFRILDKSLELTWERFETLQGNASQFLPTLGKVPRAWLKAQGYLEKGLNERWALMQELLDMLDSPVYNIISFENSYTLSLLPEAGALFSTADPVVASQELFRYRVVQQTFDRDKAHWYQVFSEQIKRTFAYVEKTEFKLKELQEGPSPSQTADVLMANLHQIPPGAASVTLEDFYSGKEVVFNFKQGQSPQKLAESLYRKSKNRKLEISKLNENLQAKRNQLAELENRIAQLNQITHFRDLKSFLKTLHLDQKKGKQEEQVPFKRFEIDGFVVLVGKSAKSNDELLRNFSHKDDLWLHAKDVSGSHVLIKFNSNKKFPKSTIEKAAGLAAYYSKSKNEPLAAVMYTPVKYVRKVKGSAPGAVRVEQEKVLLVKPSAPNE